MIDVRFFFGVFLCLICTANGAQEHKDPSQVQSTLAHVQKQIQILEKNVYQNQHQEKLLSQQLSELEKEIFQRTTQIESLEKKKIAHQQTLTVLKTQLDEFEKSHQEQLSALMQLVKVSFYHQRNEKLQLLLAPKESSLLARLDHYYRLFYAARADKIKEISAHLTKTQSLQQQTLEEQHTMLTLAQNLKAKQVQLEEKRLQRQDILAKLSKELFQSTSQLSQLQQQEQQLEQILHSLQNTLSLSPAGERSPAFGQFAKMKKKLLLPISSPGAKLSSLPHLQANQSKKTYIGAPLGTPVNAIFKGKVVFAEWLRGVGLLMIVDHGHGYISLYGNNQSLYKALGDTVNTGEIIASVGQSGGHAEPGLYFEIRKNGEALDPTPWFSMS